MYFIEVTATNIYSAVFPSEKSSGRLADFRFAHPHITAIIWNFPAENSQILLRRTSDNPDIK